MDILSHGAWGYAAIRWKGPRWAWLGAVSGMAPDILFFLPYKLTQFVRGGWSALMSYPDPDVWRANGPPLPADLVTAYHEFYVYTHSLVFLVLAGTCLALMGFRRWLWLFLPYLLHILMDIPTHERYLTPVFYPIWNWRFQGVSWTSPWIFWPNLAVLVAVHCWIRFRLRHVTLRVPSGTRH